MRTKKHIASMALCCTALAVPIMTYGSAGLAVSALDYSSIESL